MVSNGTTHAPAVTLSLAISHTPWVPARVESMRRLRAQLGITAMAMPEVLVDDGYREITDRAPNDRWSEIMWEWAWSTGASHCLFLQDDVEVCPGFWPALQALLEARPADIVGLEVAHPIARALAAEDVRLFTTSDMLIGPGYVLPREVLAALIEWRSSKLRPGWRTAADGKPILTEDTLIGVFALATGRRIVHPVPTIIDHDTSIPSTYGNDDHTHRRPAVTWKDAAQYEHAWDLECTDLAGPGFWEGRFKRIAVFAPDGTPAGHQRAHSTDPAVIAGGARVPHVGRFYDATPPLARVAVVGFGEREYRRAVADQGQREKRRLMHARAAASAGHEATARVLVCTPTRGGVHPEYSSAMQQLVQLVQVDFENGIELLDSWRWHEDVVRVRSRFLRAALETDATHVHFRDSDVLAHPLVLLGMLAADREIVATPYPRRDRIDWRRVEAIATTPARPLEAAAYHYAIGPLPEGLQPDAQECAEVAWAPLGCSLLRRDGIERLVKHYAELDDRRADLRPIVNGTANVGRKQLVQVLEDVLDELLRWRSGAMGLRYLDQVDGGDHETVALFQLLARASDATGKPRLWGEDQSFCFRARDAGLKVWCYLGHGSPADHVGEHVYRGHLKALGFERSAGAPARDVATADTDRPPAGERPFALDAPEDPAREPVEPAVP